MKISKMQVIRRVSQIISFIFFAGVFTLAFSGFQHIYISIISGNFNLTKLQMFIPPVALIIVLCILFGRVFCGWFCAFGALNDLLYTVSRKIFKKKLISDEFMDKIDSKLKYLKYVLLLVIVVFVWTLNIIPDEKLTNYSPWTAFAQATSIFDNFNTMIFAYILLAVIIVGALFIERFFCRYLCPLGALMGVMSKLKITKINKPTAKCNKCKLCTQACPMGIKLNKFEKVNSSECISCLKCVSVCPRKNAKVNIFIKSFNAMTYAVSAVIIFLVINLFGESFLSSVNAIDTKNTSNKTVATVKAITKKSQYKDGTYSGVGTGFRPDLNVSVTIKNGIISNIQVVSDNDTPGFKEQPIQTIPSEIIKSQSTNVDVVSGATFTSRGIIEAVNNALKQAKA